MRLRKAGIEDVDAATGILRQAAQWMMDNGKQQWNHSYPTVRHVRSDVERGVGFVMVDDADNILGYCAIAVDGEPAYDHLDGHWLSDGPYVVVHRMAIRMDRKGHGLGRRFMEMVENHALERGVKSFKVDTNFDNYSMLGLLDKLGFTYCGQVKYENGYRRAFEKVLI